MNKIFWSVIFIFSGCTSANTTTDECTATVGVYSIFIDENSATGTCDSDVNHNMFQFQQSMDAYIRKHTPENETGCNAGDSYTTSGNDMMLCCYCDITEKYIFEYVGKTNISGTLVTTRDCPNVPERTCKSVANFKFVLK